MKATGLRCKRALLSTASHHPGHHDLLPGVESNTEQVKVGKPKCCTRTFVTYRHTFW